MRQAFRVSPNNFVVIDSYKSPGIRNRLSRLIMRLLKR